MSRSMYRPVIAVGLAGLLLGGLLLRHHSQPSTTTTTTTVVTGASGSTKVTDTSHSDTAVVTVTGPADQVGLFGALPKPPAGAHKWAGNGAEGILTTEQFIEETYNSSAWADERASLPKRGFQYAVRVYWCMPDDSCVDTFIDHFATSTDAQSYYLARTDADAADYDARGTSTVPGVAESKVFVKAELDSVGDAKLNGLAHAGSDVVRVVTETPANPDPATLDALMTSEIKAVEARQG